MFGNFAILPAASEKHRQLCPLDKCDLVEADGPEEGLLVQHRLHRQLLQRLKLVTPQHVGKHHLRRRNSRFAKTLKIYIFTLASILIRL